MIVAQLGGRRNVNIFDGTSSPMVVQGISVLPERTSMAEIRAFRGWRYNLSRVGRLSDVIAPPYDVIDDSLSQYLHAKSPYNVVRLILEPTRPTDTVVDSRYTRSARRLNEWKENGVIVEDVEPCIYAYSQTFESEGESHTRRGFIARVRLSRFEGGAIHPHEETMPGPKADRLKLFHATGMNLSPIFGLYPDPKNEAMSVIESGIPGRKPLEAIDHLGVLHQVWPVSNALVLGELRAILNDRPIFIADGHHRYETAIAHLENRVAAGLVADAEDPANFVLMMLVSMSDPGLCILPTHRLISGFGTLASRALAELLGEHFDLESVGVGDAAGRKAWEKIRKTGRQDTLGFWTASDNTWAVATLRSRASMDAIVADHSDVWKSLGVALLHRLVLDHCLGKLGTARCCYVHLLEEVLDAARERRCELACLVPAVTVSHLGRLAETREKMPPKSTYFYPKLGSGLVFSAIQ
jgi:uncharacterized protein (DUF1015 family)